MDQSSSSSFVAAGIKRKNGRELLSSEVAELGYGAAGIGATKDGGEQERRVVLGEMDFFETEMRKEKRDRKDAAAGAGAADDLGIVNDKWDLAIDVRP